jgi:hypothetical protein
MAEDFTPPRLCVLVPQDVSSRIKIVAVSSFVVFSILLPHTLFLVPGHYGYVSR